MMFLFSFGILFIPVLLQYLIVKNTSIGANIGNFVSFSIFNLFLQLIVTISSFVLAVEAITETGNKCATGAVAMLFFGFLLGMPLLALVIVQYSKIKKIK